MANTIVQIEAPTGLATPKLELYPAGSDAIANGVGGDTLTERTNAKGIYTCTVTEALAGDYDTVLTSDAVAIGNGVVIGLVDDANTHYTQDTRDIVALSVAGNQAVADLIVPKINTALPDIKFTMILAADHVTPAPGLVPTATVSIDGGAYGAAAGTVTEIGGGVYQFDAAAADMNGTSIALRFSAATADDTNIALRTSG